MVYAGEIRLFIGATPPADWMFCDGSSLLIRDYEMLYQVIGTTYGGDGHTTFAVPDLRGRTPIGAGQNPSTKSIYALGEQGGAEKVTLTPRNIPSHTHTISARLKANSQAAVSLDPAGAYYGLSLATDKEYHEQTNAFMKEQGVAITLNPDKYVSEVKPLDNMQPYKAVHYIIAVEGLFPGNSEPVHEHINSRKTPA